MGTLKHLSARPLAFLAAALMLSTVAMAAPGVKDDGRFFSPDAVSQADTQLKAIKDKYNKTVVIETAATTPNELAGKVDGNDSSKAQAFADYAQMRTFAVGADVYVFVNKSPARIEAYRRNAERSGLSQSGQDRMVQDLAGRFRQKDFDGGLANLTKSLDVTFASGPAAAGSNAPPAAQVPARQDAPPAADGRGAPVANRPADGGGTGLLPKLGCFGFLVIAVVIFLAFRLIGRLFNRNRGIPPAGYGQQPGAPGYGQPGYGPGSYGQPGYGQGGGGGGFGRGVGGGILGGLLGSWIGGNVFGGQSHHGGDNSGSTGNDSGGGFGGGGFGGGGDTGGASGADFGDSGGGGADFGGGGGSDFGGGGDSGGSSGSDF